MISQLVWVKKHDLAYALRVPPDIEADLAGRAASFWSLLLCVWRGGLNNRITVCTSQSGRPREFGQPRAPIMKTTGGGLLGPEELEVLRPVKQIISGIKTNAPGKIELENGEVVPCDWVIWCHGYDVRRHRRHRTLPLTPPHASRAFDPHPQVEKRNAEVPRDTMEFFLFDKGCFIPMNFFAGAATGGRPLGRAFLLWEDGLLKWYHSYIWTFWCRVCFQLGGAANSTTWWLKGAILERVFLHWVVYPACKHTQYKRFGETSLSSTEMFWPRKFRSFSEFFCYW